MLFFRKFFGFDGYDFEVGELKVLVWVILNDHVFKFFFFGR